jgi:beta-D-xylosidase 4
MSAGIPCRYTTPLQGLGKYTATIYKPGCENVACHRNPMLIHEASQAASQADATVIIVGADQSIEAEGLDRVSLLLPGQQEHMVLETAAALKRTSDTSSDVRGTNGHFICQI